MNAFHKSPGYVSSIILRRGCIAAFLAFRRILALREIKHLAVADDGQFEPFLALVLRHRLGHEMGVPVAIHAVSVLPRFQVQIDLAVGVLRSPGPAQVDHDALGPGFGCDEAGTLKAQKVDGYVQFIHGDGIFQTVP